MGVTMALMLLILIEERRRTDNDISPPSCSRNTTSGRLIETSCERVHNFGRVDR